MTLWQRVVEHANLRFDVAEVVKTSGPNVGPTKLLTSSATL